MTASRRGLASRGKGNGFERLVANMLTDATGEKWRRRVRQHEGDSDVVCENPVFSRLSIECKHANRLCLPAWWRQTLAQAGASGIPILIYRQTGGAVRVQIDAYNANNRHWPVPGRYTVTMEWDAAVQWLREMIPSKTFSPEIY